MTGPTLAFTHPTRLTQTRVLKRLPGRFAWPLTLIAGRDPGAAASDDFANRKGSIADANCIRGLADPNTTSLLCRLDADACRGLGLDLPAR